MVLSALLVVNLETGFGKLVLLSRYVDVSEKVNSFIKNLSIKRTFLQFKIHKREKSRATNFRPIQILSS